MWGEELAEGGPETPAEDVIGPWGLLVRAKGKDYVTLLCLSFTHQPATPRQNKGLLHSMKATFLEVTNAGST